MSLANLLGDIFSGNFKNAEARIENWWSGVSPSIQAFITTIETDEGAVLESLVSVAAKDVIAGGLNTASFLAAIKDVGEQLLEKNITMANTVITAALNTEVMSQASAAGVTVPTNAGPAVVPPVAVPVSTAS